MAPAAKPAQTDEIGRCEVDVDAAPPYSAAAGAKRKWDTGQWGPAAALPRERSAPCSLAVGFHQFFARRLK